MFIFNGLKIKMKIEINDITENEFKSLNWKLFHDIKTLCKVTFHFDRSISESKQELQHITYVRYIKANYTCKAVQGGHFLEGKGCIPEMIHF